MIDVERKLPLTDRVDVKARGWHVPRLIASVVLVAWAALFWLVQLSGRTPLYLSRRTEWLVPVGAAVLSVTSVGVLATVRGRARVEASRRSVRTAAVMILPVLAIGVAPPITLGSFSADRKPAFSGGGRWTYWGTFNESSEITMFFVTAALYSDEAAEILATRAGEEVTFEGFVRREADTPADEFLLARFVVTCCVADAAVAQLRVVDVVPGSVVVDDWVKVSGRIYPVGDQIIVTAERIEPIETPGDPYLTA